MEIIKQYTIDLLTELITEYVRQEWTLDFYTWFINSKWYYVTIQERSDSTWIDYSIRSTMLDSSYWNENEIEWWEIIFQFNDDYYWIDIDEVGYYQEDYISYLKDKDKYIKDKVEYIIYLTW